MFKSVSWVNSSVRHVEGRCGTEKMQFMEEDDPRIDSIENTLKKKACKNCVRYLKGEQDAAAKGITRAVQLRNETIESTYKFIWGHQ